MKRPGLVILFLLLLTPQVSAVNVWEHINTSREMYSVSVTAFTSGKPPKDPLNHSAITVVEIRYVLDEEHVFSVSYSAYDGKWAEEVSPRYPQYWDKTPFNFSVWNTTEVLAEYQWGLENYLPNITGEVVDGVEWPEKYWVRRISRWEVWINASKFQVTLYGDCTEICVYITFQCRNPENMTCNWSEPIVETHSMIPPTTTTTPKQEEKTCGPGLLIGLVLITLLTKQKR
ncbi:CGP-CTERM sorting domain-containing protein [Thermococcus camini]|uniref:Uncharacterized protein n=1 Tax=Thermococcus camini TaxID=2016373 RepID=A0A7G2D998_9EURY|nr:CGP-CTERM sorting domain-containing protein [Thermococcus camini]CAD5243516.1 conserved exported protein of unknown function [Thermococcus camini]